MQPDPTVFVIDDDQQARESVRVLVQSMGVNAAAFASAEEFLAALDPDHPGCVVTDMRMTGMSGLELQDELITRSIGLPVIIVSAYAKTAVTVRAMQKGAVTILEKPYDDNDLWDGIRAALALDAERRSKREYLAELGERFGRLTPKEREVVRGIVAGKPNKRIASELRVSERTIENRRREIFTKTKTASVAELVRLVIDLGEDAISD